MGEEIERIEMDFQLLFDNSFDAILLTAPNGSIYRANKAAMEMFGYSTLEFFIAGRNGIMDTSDPRLKTALEIRASTGKFMGELTGIKKDGTKFPVELSSSIFKDEKGNEYSCTIIRDISKRVNMERTLAEQEANARAIMEASNETLLLVDLSGRIIDCNETFTQRLKAPREVLIGKNIFHLESFLNLETRKEAMVKTIESGEPLFLELEVSGRWYDIAIKPVRYKNEVTNRCAIFSKDITAQKMAEQALRENEENLKRLNATKDQFFSIVAHDIKNPMSAIVGFSELFMEKLKDLQREDLNQMAALIHKSSTGVVELLDNLSTWARAQTGRLSFKPKEVDLTSLIHEVISLLQGQSLAKSISIRLNLPETLKVIADVDMISTIVRNLVSNAIKFTDSYGMIILSAQTNERETIVSIQDNGIGMKKERLNALFQIESTLSSRGTHNEKGTGLGLIICKEFIQLHGGSIWAESEPGKGSRFSFSIPVSRKSHDL